MKGHHLHGYDSHFQAAGRTFETRPARGTVHELA
jgi:hypothetical protein